MQIYGALSVSGEFAEAKGADTNGAPAAGGSSIRGGNIGGGPMRRRASTYPTGPARRQRVRTSVFAVVKISATGSTWASRRRCRSRWAASRRSAPAATALFAGWRNSGVWLGGRWGEVGLGLWDLPFNMNQTVGAGHAPYANASTSMAAGLLGGGLGSTAAGTVSGQDFGQFCGASGLGATVTTCFNDAFSFHRRQSNQIWYQSPTWAGFRARVAYGATSGATSNATNDGAATPGESSRSCGALACRTRSAASTPGSGYENHEDYITSHARAAGTNITTTGAVLASTAGTACAGFGNGFALGGQVAGGGAGATAACMPIGSGTAVGLSGDKSFGWNGNLRYTFGFGLSIGGYYEYIKWEMDYANTTGAEVGLLNDAKREAWRLDAAYQLGAHTFGIQ